MLMLRVPIYTFILFLAFTQGAIANTLEKQVIDTTVNQQAVCMDGSPAVYFINAEETQKNWIIMLGGGIPCGTLENCQQALQTKQNMTSSLYRWDAMHGTGLLSDDERNNPTFSAWNKVFIPQCSMDVWVGKQKASQASKGLSFQGSSILHGVIRSLKHSGLDKASTLILVGNSAGGIGVMNHIDWVASQLPKTKVKGIVDGSWILDAQPFPSRSTIHQDITKRLSTLEVQVDEDCAQAHPDDQWHCIMGTYVYPHIQSPLFIRISQTDPVHLRRLGISQHPSNQQRAYIQKHATDICQSLTSTNNFFSLRGTPHTVVKNKRAFSLSYQGQSFYDAITQFVQKPKTSIKITDCFNDKSN